MSEYTVKVEKTTPPFAVIAKKVMQVQQLKARDENESAWEFIVTRSSFVLGFYSSSLGICEASFC